jgi:DNA-binding FadR family transcriptional regulator
VTTGTGSIDSSDFLIRRNSRKTAHLVASDLRKQIVRGHVGTEHALPTEVELMSAFQVSRETVREALGILESESLIRVRRGRSGGAIAQRPTLVASARQVALLLQTRRATRDELLEAKDVLEGPAGAMLAEQRPVGAIETLERLYREELGRSNDELAFAAAVTAFDETVCRLGGSRTLMTVSGVLREAYLGELYRALGRARTARRVGDLIRASHARFLEALRGRDVPDAVGAWESYLADLRPLFGTGGSERRLNIVPLWRARDARAPIGRASGPRMAISIAAEIRARIAAGILRDGDRVGAVPDLAQEFSVSRPTLREALRVLETEGLIVIRAGSRAGAIVRRPQARIAADLAGIVLEIEGTTLGDVWEARLLVEPRVMGLAARRITGQRLEQLRQACDEMSALVGNTAEFSRVSMDFRFAILAASRNRALAVVFEIIRWVAAGSRGTVAATAAGLPWEARSNRRWLADYRALVDALERRDESESARLWYDHVVATAPALLSQLGTRSLADLLDY